MIWQTKQKNKHSNTNTTQQHKNKQTQNMRQPHKLTTSNMITLITNKNKTDTHGWGRCHIGSNQVRLNTISIYAINKANNNTKNEEHTYKELKTKSKTKHININKYNNTYIKQKQI